MPFIPIIANNLGKIVATLAAGTFGYANRKTVGRWLADGDEASEPQECMRQKEARSGVGGLTMDWLLKTLRCRPIRDAVVAFLAALAAALGQHEHPAR